MFYCVDNNSLTNLKLIIQQANLRECRNIDFEKECLKVCSA